MTLEEIFRKHGQPLSTAPRDGTVIQAFASGKINHVFFGGHGGWETLGGIMYLNDINEKHFPDERWLPVYAYQNSKEGK